MAKSPSVTRPECGTGSGSLIHEKVGERFCTACLAWRREYRRRFYRTESLRNQIHRAWIRREIWTRLYWEAKESLYSDGDEYRSWLGPRMLPSTKCDQQYFWPAVFRFADFRDTMYMYRDLLNIQTDTYLRYMHRH